MGLFLGIAALSSFAYQATVGAMAGSPAGPPGVIAGVGVAVVMNAHTIVGAFLAPTP